MNFERSVKLLDGIEKKTTNTFVGDSLEDLIQGVLLGLKGVIPDCRSTRAIDDFENPRPLMLSAIDQDLDGRPIPGDPLAEWGGNDLVLIGCAHSRYRLESGGPEWTARDWVIGTKRRHLVVCLRRTVDVVTVPDVLGTNSPII